MTLAPFVGLNLEAVSPVGDGIHGAGVDVFVIYAFQVTGGNPGDLVPIRIGTSLSITSTGSLFAYAFAGVTIHTGAAGTSTLAAVCTDGTCGTTARSFSGTLSFRARSGDTGDFLFLQIDAATTGNASSAAPTRP